MHEADMKRIRGLSLQKARQLGFPTNPSLPLSDIPAGFREAPEVIDRILAMHCVAACAYGFSREKAWAWYGREVQWDALTEAERGFLRTGVGDRQQFMVQIEGMWVLAWAISLVGSLDFGQPCSESFAGLLPDLKMGQDASRIRAMASVRPLEELVIANDLAYCLHWAVRHAELSEMPPTGGIGPNAIVERRRALEWLFGKEAWDEVSLDT